MTYVCGYKGIFDMSEVEDFDCPTIDNYIGIGFMQVGKYLDGSKLLDGKNILDGYAVVGMGASVSHKGWGVSHRPPLLDGSKLLDGSSLLDGIGGMDFDSKSISNRIFVKNESEIGLNSKTDLGISFWKARYLSGDDILDGSVLLNSTVGKAEQRLNSFIGLQDDDGTVDGLIIETHSRNYAFLDGGKNLDGTRMLNSIYRKEEVQ